jgi:ornithine cyclodeaminase/alanine dehydrogenase-like protein (mu-crystallin family)
MSSDAEARAVEAERILKSTLYRESWEQVERNINAIRDQVATSAEKAEELRQLVIALRKARQYLEQVIVTGEMETLNKRQNFVQSLLKRA